MKKKWNLLTAMLLAVVMMLSVTITASAAEEEKTLDMDTKGSIEIQLKVKDADVKEGEEPPVAEGIYIDVYKVGVPYLEDNNLRYKLVEPLEFTGVELEALNAEENYANALEIWKKIREEENRTLEPFEGLETWEGVTDKEGKVIFKDLPVGVYMIRQSRVSAEYYSFSIFLHYLPVTDAAEDDADEDVWYFNTMVQPKVTVKDQTDTGESKKDPEIIIDPPDVPLSGNPGLMDITDPDVPLSDLMDIGDEEPPLAMLPATGALQWPIPVMAVAGLLLFGAGWLSDKKARKSYED